MDRSHDQARSWLRREDVTDQAPSWLRREDVGDGSAAGGALAFGFRVGVARGDSRHPRLGRRIGPGGVFVDQAGIDQRQGESCSAVSEPVSSGGVPLEPGDVGPWVSQACPLRRGAAGVVGRWLEGGRMPGGGEQRPARTGSRRRPPSAARGRRKQHGVRTEGGHAEARYMLSLTVMKAVVPSGRRGLGARSPSSRLLGAALA